MQLSESSKEKIIFHTPIIFLVLIGCILGVADSIKNRNAPPAPKPELSDIEIMMRFYDAYTKPTFLGFLSDMIGMAGLMILALLAGQIIRQIIIG